MKSVMGRFVFLADKTSNIVNTVCWKGKSIPTVCKSPKASETRSADKAIEDAVFVARTINEIYTGKRGENQIPVSLYTDSQALIDSVNSTKQIDDKLLRPIIKWIKQCLDASQLEKITWCDTDVCLADMLTKSGSRLTDRSMEVIHGNKMIDLSYSKKKQGAPQVEDNFC